MAGRAVVTGVLQGEVRPGRSRGLGPLPPAALLLPLAAPPACRCCLAQPRQLTAAVAFLNMECCRAQPRRLALRRQRSHSIPGEQSWRWQMDESQDGAKRTMAIADYVSSFDKLAALHSEPSRQRAPHPRPPPPAFPCAAFAGELRQQAESVAAKHRRAGLERLHPLPPGLVMPVPRYSACCPLPLPLGLHPTASACAQQCVSRR